MSPSLWKNVLRDISKSKARSISIMLIVALGVGFFTGIKATSPSMNATAEEYYSENNLMDIRLLSTVGFSDKDVEEIKKLDHIRAVSPSYFTDAMVNIGGAGSVIRLYSNPTADENGLIMNKPLVNEGRLPEKKGEIALESSNLRGSGYAVGDTITLEAEISGEDTTDTLENLEYTIVGLVQSPLYVSFERGTTTIGNGSISLFGIVSEDEFLSNRYTQIYVLTDYSDGSMETLSDEYDSLVAELEPQFKELGLERAKDFDSEYLVDAKQRLSDAQQELDSEKANAEKELDDAKESLDSAEKEYNEKIADAQKKLDDSKKQLDAAQSDIDQGWIDYENGIKEGEKKINESDAQLKAAQEQLKTAKNEFNTQIRNAEKELNAAEREYEKGLEEYNSGLSEFNKSTASAKLAISVLQSDYDLKKNKYENITKPTCEGLISEAQRNIYNAEEEKVQLQAEIEQTESTAQKIILQAEIDSLDRAISRNQGIIDVQNEKLGDAEAEVDEAKSALDSAAEEYIEATAEPQAQLDEAKAQLDSAKEQIDSGRAELTIQKAAGEEQLANAQTQITDAQTALSEGKQELSTQKTEGKQKLKDAEKELADGKEKYEDGKKEFEEQKEEGRQKLDDAQKKYEDAKAEAAGKIADAQAEIDKAKEKLDDLENPEWYFLTRLDNPGYTSLIDDTTRVDAVATVFPLFFLLVAALVCLTTLTRHVEEKRTEIGTLKALGYSNGAIKSQFIIYATGASLIGCVVGIGIGVFTLPYVIYSAYGIMYELIPLELHIPWVVALFGVLAAFMCTTLVALYTCQKVLREKPSELMRPKAPKAGKQIMLERIPFLWNRMNFTSKVTARNISRYKARFFMTVIGVAGCTALILTGFGLKNSISSIADKQFGEIITYDMIAVLDDEGTSHQKQGIMSELRNSEFIDCAMLERQTAVEVKDANGKNTQDEIYMIVPQSIEDMQNFIHLRERSAGSPIELTDNGVVITEKMAKNLGVSVGDSVIVVDDYREYTVPVTGIAENYIYGYVYISPQYYKEVYGKDALFNMIMGKMTDTSSENESKLGTRCLDNDDVVAVSFISNSLENFNDTVRSLDTVVIVLIFCAGLLAVVVLYNLTNINVAERVREIATIKVLGFYNGETCAFVYRENIVLTLCGIAAGLGIGVILHRFVILTIEINKTMFGREIALYSFVFAALLTALFAAVVNFVMYFKIKQIDMIESLKSIE